MRNPVHCTPKVFLAGNSGGRLLSVRLMLASVRVASRLGARSGPASPSHHAFAVFGLQAGLAVGSGEKTVRHRRSIGAQELGSRDIR